MAVWPSAPRAGTKTLLDGIVLPAGQTPQQDLKAALDIIFNHPNVGPVHLAPADPAPGHLQSLARRTSRAWPRCSTTTARRARRPEGGDPGDPARTPRRAIYAGRATDFGKLREPVIRFANFLRASGAKAANGRNSDLVLDSPEEGLSQSPLLAPSVFNFFCPIYARPGAIAAAGLVAPEFQINTETRSSGTRTSSDVLWNAASGSTIPGG